MRCLCRALAVCLAATVLCAVGIAALDVRAASAEPFICADVGATHVGPYTVDPHEVCFL